MARRKRTGEDFVGLLIVGLILGAFYAFVKLVQEHTGIILLAIFVVLICLVLFASKDNFKPKKLANLTEVDDMSGLDFEAWCANLLSKNGFSNVYVTPRSGDQGVDIIAWKKHEKYAIQCKRYSKAVGNKPIQEVYTGKTIYGCSRAIVITNNYFTPGAVKAAKATNVELWDRNTLANLIPKK